MPSSNTTPWICKKFKALKPGSKYLKLNSQAITLNIEKILFTLSVSCTKHGNLMLLGLHITTTIAIRLRDAKSLFLCNQLHWSPAPHCAKPLAMPKDWAIYSYQQYLHFVTMQMTLVKPICKMPLWASKGSSRSLTSQECSPYKTHYLKQAEAFSQWTKSDSSVPDIPEKHAHLATAYMPTTSW